MLDDNFKLTSINAGGGEVQPHPGRKPTKPFLDATVIGLQHAMRLAEQSARAYQAVQGLRPPTLAVFQATRSATSHRLLSNHWRLEVSVSQFHTATTCLPALCLAIGAAVMLLKCKTNAFRVPAMARQAVSYVQVCHTNP